ncbi:hypothetical protein J2S11_001410 [Bacillus horti]|uniref:Uncharacterized protein n=1 Tax=Caldalkalibacillus horti TaxID=77523 RepID=A0ABT9VX05_9BACI|nr:hypothetical protein [Bacillus horti]
MLKQIKVLIIGAWKVGVCLHKLNKLKQMQALHNEFEGRSDNF